MACQDLTGYNFEKVWSWHIASSPEIYIHTVTEHIRNKKSQTFGNTLTLSLHHRAFALVVQPVT